MSTADRLSVSGVCRASVHRSRRSSQSRGFIRRLNASLGWLPVNSMETGPAVTQWIQQKPEDYYKYKMALHHSKVSNFYKFKSVVTEFWKKSILKPASNKRRRKSSHVTAELCSYTTLLRQQMRWGGRCDDTSCFRQDLNTPAVHSPEYFRQQPYHDITHHATDTVPLMLPRLFISQTPTSNPTVTCPALKRMQKSVYRMRVEWVNRTLSGPIMSSDWTSLMKSLTCAAAEHVWRLSVCLKIRPSLQTLALLWTFSHSTHLHSFAHYTKTV